MADNAVDGVTTLTSVYLDDCFTSVRSALDILPLDDDSFFIYSYERQQAVIFRP